VAFSALSRIKEDQARFKSYFLKGYSFIVAMTIPITLFCALFARDMIFVVLGQKWMEAVPIFRLLAPTILIFALINPMAWLLFSLGLVGRSLRIALVLAPLVIAGYVVGLPYGPKGIALAYSTVMTLWVVPHIAWCVHGTVISLRDIFGAVSRPLLSSVVAATLAFGLQFFYGSLLTPLPRLVLGSVILLGTYVCMLLYVMGQKTFYLNLVRGLGSRPVVEETTLVSP
jgi:PST family polysaccharide transporter